jgi:hypothetical protein
MNLYFLHPVKILIILLYILKKFTLCEEFPQNINPEFTKEWK